MNDEWFSGVAVCTVRVLAVEVAEMVFEFPFVVLIVTVIGRIFFRGL